MNFDSDCKKYFYNLTRREIATAATKWVLTDVTKCNVTRRAFMQSVRIVTENQRLTSRIRMFITPRNVVSVCTER